jgi:rhodanese-related sulfurtransferase
MPTIADRIQRPTPEQLAVLAPLASLSHERLHELSGIAHLERVARGTDPVSGRSLAGQSLFLLRGEMLLVFASGGTKVVVGGAGEGRYALNPRGVRLERTKAITDAELLTLEEEALDILVTWDQLAAQEPGRGSALGSAARRDTQLLPAVFPLAKLRRGIFAAMPAARIDELFSRFDRLSVHSGDAVICEGDEGDYYYVIESGRFRVERAVGGVSVVLAELRSGDAFGEEALVAEARRNATVVATTEGRLLRLGRPDFNELLREPLLTRLTLAEARERVARGALWLDVRYPSEFQYDRLPGAVNVPLNEVRNMFALLDKEGEYVTYCQSGRRSAAAAFLFAQRGFRVAVLEGGLWAASERA